MRAALGEAFHELLVRGGHGPGAGAARILVAEIGEDAKAVDGTAQSSECGSGGFSGTGEGERGAAMGRRGLVRITSSGSVAEGVLAGQVAQQPGQVPYFIVQNLAEPGARLDLVRKRELVGHGVDPVGYVVQQHPLVGIGQRRCSHREVRFYRRAAGCLAPGGAPSVGAAVLIGRDGVGAACRKLTPMPWAVSCRTALCSSRARASVL